MENLRKDLNEMPAEVQKTNIEVDHELTSEVTSIPLTLVDPHQYDHYVVQNWSC